MTKLKRLLAAILAACIALSLAACGDTRWICEVDGETIPAGLYIYYQTEGYGDALYSLMQEDNDTYLYPYLYYYNYGVVEPTLFDAVLSSGESVEDHINSYALDMCRQSVIVDKLFTQLGLELSEDEKTLAESQARSMWQSNGEHLEEIGVSQDSLELAIISNIKETRVFDAYYEVGGKNGTTEEELEDYFAENYARIKYMTFTFADSADDAIDEARKSEQLELANKYLEEAKAGTPMDELIERHQQELDEEAAAEAEADNADASDTESDEAAGTETGGDNLDASGTDETGGDEADDETEETDAVEDPYPNETILSKDGTYPTEKFVTYVFNKVKTGDFSVVQDDTCFYVVERLDIKDRTDVYDSYRDSIMNDLFDSEYTTLINNELEKYTVLVNEKAQKRYKAKNAFPDAFEE